MVRVRRRGQRQRGCHGEGEGECCRSYTEGEISRHGLGRKVQEIGSVRDLGSRLGARDSGFFPFVGLVRRGAASQGPSHLSVPSRIAGARDRTWQRMSHEDSVHVLITIVTGINFCLPNLLRLLCGLS